MNQIIHCGGMTSFGQRVKEAWKNIYPLQDADEEKKKKNR